MIQSADTPLVAHLVNMGYHITHRTKAVDSVTSKVRYLYTVDIDGETFGRIAHWWKNNHLSATHKIARAMVCICNNRTPNPHTMNAWPALKVLQEEGVVESALKHYEDGRECALDMFLSRGAIRGAECVANARNLTGNERDSFIEGFNAMMDEMDWRAGMPYQEDAQ